MQIDQRSEGDITILQLSGQFDAFQLSTASIKIDRLIRDGARKLVLDMEPLEFINSTALGYLIKTQKRLHDLGGEFVLASAPEAVRSPIRVLRVDDLFRQYDDVPGAIGHFR